MSSETKRNPKARLRKPRIALPAGDVVKLIFGTKPGLLAAIERLRAAEIRASQDYELALSTNDPDLIARKKKDWCDLIEQLRKVEQSNPDIQKANAQTLPVSDVVRETARMCNAFRVALESLPRSLPQKLIGQDQIAIQEVLAKAINDALAQLHTGKWNDENGE
jgi:hypothetical protein